MKHNKTNNKDKINIGTKLSISLFELKGIHLS